MSKLYFAVLAEWGLPRFRKVNGSYINDVIICLQISVKLIGVSNWCRQFGDHTLCLK